MEKVTLVELKNYLDKYLEDGIKKFIAHTHIFLYVMRKNFAIMQFILTCKINKDYKYYESHPLGYFTRKLENEK